MFVRRPIANDNPQFNRESLQRALQEQGIGTVENHEQTEKRLLQLFTLEEKDLFRSPEESVARAYKMQGEKVAYHEENLVLREEPPRYGN